MTDEERKELDEIFESIEKEMKEYERKSIIQNGRAIIEASKTILNI